MIRSAPTRGLLAASALSLGAATFTTASDADATWSIIIIDTETKEIAIGSATCLTFFDLKEGTPVLVVEKGGATAQALVDGGARNRSVIWSNLQFGVDPIEILDVLKLIDGAHQSRQYGIVDTQGRALTFSGFNTLDWAGGVTGSTGTLVYAVQGNILTGEPVVLEAEAAILNTPGDIPEKLMAAMEAAREMGGDGRCSCSPQDPTGCGSPPDQFTKSAHIAYMLIARPGDSDGNCTSGQGCATGDYFMDFNIANANFGDPDPVFTLRDWFDDWRVELQGRPDGVQSTTRQTVETLRPDGQSIATISFELLDWEGAAITAPIQSITVEHGPESAGICDIGPVVDLGGGMYEFEVTAGVCTGLDEFRIQVDDGVRPVTIAPDPELRIEMPPDEFQLAAPTPGIAGETNTLCASNGEPGSTVVFVYSTQLGSTNTACGTLGIRAPIVAGEAIVGADGVACIDGFVPRSFRGDTLYTQAVERESCARSNVSCWTFE
ncbi:MAG: DUF1028 domain-containing protein [Phycisphaerales bacterium]